MAYPTASVFFFKEYRAARREPCTRYVHDTVCRLK
jgi:hypothetical protein